jgi:hypothetical protein
MTIITIFNFLLGWKHRHYLMNKNMEEDLRFYINHNNEMYFDGMSTIAIIIVAMMLLLSGYLLYNLSMSMVEMFIILVLLVICGVWFSIIKMYFHIRKDAIEIKELIEKKVKPVEQPIGSRGLGFLFGRW